jgi:hypothetical protein
MSSSWTRPRAATPTISRIDWDARRSRALVHHYHSHTSCAALVARFAIVRAQIAVFVGLLYHAIATMRTQLAVGQASAVNGIIRRRVRRTIVADFAAVFLHDSVPTVGTLLTVGGAAAAGAVVLAIVTGFAAVCLNDARSRMPSPHTDLHAPTALVGFP